MPELPEVETIREDLSRFLRGQKISRVNIRLPKQIHNPIKNFRRAVIGAEITAVRRRAKLIIMDLKVAESPAAKNPAAFSLIFHLKMTGQLIYRVPKNSSTSPSVPKFAGGGHPIKHDLKNLPNRYTHVIFYFKNGAKLFFNDLRQFGFVKLVSATELNQIESALGPEPLSSTLTPAHLRALFAAHPKWEIKPALMEQKILAGIGNIYASEILFAAPLAPTRPVKSLTLADWKKIHSAMLKILRQAIKKRGTSSENYVDALGREGSMNNFLKVYQRAGQPCPRCGTPIESFRQKQRTTFWCAECQK